VALKSKGQPQAALGEYQKALELDPQRQMFRNNVERLQKQLSPHP
jgi:Tfp pilus assembly protein PilF